MNALKGALEGVKIGGPVGAIAGGALGMMAGENEKGQQALDDMVGALDQGRQQVMDMRNGIELDDNDRSLVANSIEQGYGVY